MTGHSHSFGQERPRIGESRVRWVIAMTALTMVVEIVAGIVFGSMALLADGLHMASHATALAITAFAYAFARRHANDPRFSFGTGKVNALAAFASAVILAGFALVMVWESTRRLVTPVSIDFDDALVVAVLGLLVNGLSVLILGHHGEHDHDHHDHNRRAAFLHVLADALTSVLAIVALLTAKIFGSFWMDPAMGIVGAALVARWSWGLMQDASGVLLDRQESPENLDTIRRIAEADGRGRVVDLHLWRIGPGLCACIVSIASDHPIDPADIEARLPAELDIAHLTVEVWPAAGDDE